MSHFSVLVITDTKPTDAALEALLLPFHEFECTGITQYVQDIDITEDARSSFDPDTDGEFAPWAASYYGYPVIPSGTEPDTDGACKFGYIQNDRVIKRTNPNAKWDWWVIGGRYRDRLVLKTGTLCDSASWGSLNHASMAEARRRQRHKTWHDATSRAPMNAETREMLYGIPTDATYESYVNTDPGFTTFAVLANGAWCERGEMGWWGMVSNENPDWSATYADIVGAIRPDQWVTIIDCHI